MEKTLILIGEMGGSWWGRLWGILLPIQKHVQAND